MRERYPRSIEIIAPIFEVVVDLLGGAVDGVCVDEVADFLGEVRREGGGDGRDGLGGSWKNGNALDGLVVAFLIRGMASLVVGLSMVARKVRMKCNIAIRG